MSVVGPWGTEWQVGPDGLLFRKAGRVVVLNGKGQALLVLGRDFGDYRRQWWFTIGGGLLEGETSRVGAARELAEETGILIDAKQLVGPVLRREAVFHFSQIKCRQFEEFFLWQTQTELEIDTSGLSESEQEVLTEFRWWQGEDLACAQEDGVEVFPVQLPELITKWSAGWDGTCEVITESDDKN